MSSHHVFRGDFGYRGEPGTCLWCGQRIPARGTNHGDRALHYGDAPMFDSQGCAVLFAMRAAGLGYRLELKQPELPLETPEERRRNAMQAELLERARTLVPQMRARRRCADCGKVGELTGHQDCPTPRDREEFDGTLDYNERCALDP